MITAQIELKELRVEGSAIVVYIPEPTWRAMGSPATWTPTLIDAAADAVAEWVPLELAARQLAKDLASTPERARYRIANDLRSPKPKLKDNGKTGRDRAVEAGSFAKFRLDLRDKALADDGWDNDE